MDGQVTDLFEHPHYIPLVARWIYDEFWADKEIHTPESLADLLRRATRRNEVPLSLLGFVSGKPVGTVSLIENDDDSRTRLHPWLAALFVVPDYRRRGTGSMLVRVCNLGRNEACETARDRLRYIDRRVAGRRRIKGADYNAERMAK